MATKTSLLGLTKPAYTDAADIAVLNTNFDLIDKAVGQGARVWNLLDNSWFGNPIAQAGQNGMHGSTKYVCDRWISWDADATFANGCITPGSPIDQRISLNMVSVDKTYTVAFCLSDGTIKASSGTLRNGAGSYNFGMHAIAEASYVRVRLMTGFEIRWAALYEGAYTAETIPTYVYKGYAAELTECQRYYLHVCSSYNDWLTVSYAHGWGVVMEIASPVKMRATPSAAVLNEGIKVFTSSGWTGANAVTVTSVMPRGGSVFLLLSGTNGAIGLDAGKTYLAAGLAGLSADL